MAVMGSPALLPHIDPKPRDSSADTILVRHPPASLDDGGPVRFFNLHIVAVLYVASMEIQSRKQAGQGRVCLSFYAFQLSQPHR